LDGANLDGANLYHANLYRANLDGANLHHASLYRANLDGANLDGANLDGANLDDARLPIGLLFDERGFNFGFSVENKKIKFQIGCRKFTIEEVRNHWQSEFYCDKKRGERIVKLFELCQEMFDSGDIDLFKSEAE